MSKSVLAQASGGYSASGGSAGDVYLRSILTIPATTPSTSQPATLFVVVSSSVQGSANGSASGDHPYHVDFAPTGGGTPFEVPLTAMSPMGVSQYPNAIAFTRFVCTDARIALGGKLTLSVFLNPSATANHTWFGHAGTSDQGSIAALVLDLLTGAGNDASVAFGTFSSTNTGTSKALGTVSVSPNEVRLFTYGAVNTTSPSLSGFTNATNVQLGTALITTANGSTTHLAVTLNTTGSFNSISPTWTWTTSSVSVEQCLDVIAVTHVAPPAAYAPPAVAGRNFAAVIG